MYPFVKDVRDEKEGTMQYAQELATWRFEIVLAPLPSPSSIVLF